MSLSVQQQAALIGFVFVLGSKMTSLATAYLVPKQQLQTRLSPSHQFIHYPFGFIASGLLEFIQFRI